MIHCPCCVDWKKENEQLKRHYETVLENYRKEMKENKELKQRLISKLAVCGKGRDTRHS